MEEMEGRGEESIAVRVQESSCGNPDREPSSVVKERKQVTLPIPHEEGRWFDY